MSKQEILVLVVPSEQAIHEIEIKTLFNLTLDDCSFNLQPPFHGENGLVYTLDDTDERWTRFTNWLREKHLRFTFSEVIDEDEEDEEEETGPTLDDIAYARKRLSQEWIQNEFGDGAVDAIFEGLTLLEATLTIPTKEDGDA